jgi:hypothetical protein
MTPSQEVAIQYVVMLLLAIWGGFVAYIRKVNEGQPYVFWRMVGELATSAFAGILVGALMLDAGSSAVWAGASAGIAGHMGATIIKVAEDMLASALRAMGKLPERRKHQDPDYSGPERRGDRNASQ